MILPYDLRSALKKYKQYIYCRYFLKPSDPDMALFTSEWFTHYLTRKFGSHVRMLDDGPISPPELIETEALRHAYDLKGRYTPVNYFGSGRRDVWTMLTLLEKYGAHITTIRSVLDFGCGSARVVRHFRNIADLKLAGTDANLTPIEWNRKNLPGIEFSHNGLQPPLSYQDGSFDFVYALSVFTHIPLEWQRAWLDELHRVLRPGGYLLCTTHGERFISWLSNEDQLTLQREGNLVLDAKSADAHYSTQVLGSWDIYQSPDEIRKAFGENLELLCYEREAVAGQDALILRKSLSPV
jgi:ubiquinone/menaquinone biosynthesis C-methylase UbiE